MQTFSKRNNLRKEYSGHEIASPHLRNRLLQLYGHPYSGNEFNLGAGNDNWIHEHAFHKDLQMHFGDKVELEHFRSEEKTSYEDVFDFIELYYARGMQDLDHNKRLRLLNDIELAFVNSGSVYKFSEDGQVLLKIEDKVAEDITVVDNILEPHDEARQVYRESIDGLLTRSKAPKDIVGDMYIVFEEYIKKISNSQSLEKAIQYLRTNLSFHPTQIKIIEKLLAYRGDVWGPAHAGNSPIPDEKDSLWYTESIITQIKYISNKIKDNL